MKNTSRISILVFATAIFLAAAALPIFLYLQIQNAQVKIIEARGKIESSASGEQEDSRIKQLFRDTEVERAKLDALAPKKDEAANVIAAIESLGKTAKVALDVGGVTLSDKNPTFSVLQISLHASGTFASVMQFLKLLETIGYVSTVDAVSLSATGPGGWQMTSSLSVLVQKNI